MISRAGASPRRNTIRPGVPLAGFAAAAETTSVAGPAAGPGSQAGRPGPGPAWLAGRTSCPQQRRPDAGGDSAPGRQAGHGDQVMERVAPGHAGLGVVSTARLLRVWPGPARGRVRVRGAVRVPGGGQSRPAMARPAWPWTAGFYPGLTTSGAMAALYSGLRVTGACPAAG
jgi:hypothetical protein